MKTLVFGGAGMLGQDLLEQNSERHQVVCLSRQQADITKPESIAKVIDQHKPDHVIIAAAWTDVDGAETHQDQCRQINVDGPAHVGSICAKLSIPTLLVSTDYVFSKISQKPHGEDDPHEPLNVYGQSKSDGEKALAASGAPWIVVRTSWLFGIYGKNFCQTMVNLAQTNDSLKVVDDQIGSPTWTYHLAQGLLKVLEKDLRGNFHLSAQGQTSWYGLAQEALRLNGMYRTLIPVNSEEFPRPAARPRWSVLGQNKTKKAGIVLPPWQEGVRGWHKKSTGLSGW